MQVTNEELKKMRANYGTASDERIRALLARVKPVVIGDKGMDTVRGYYALDGVKMAEVLADPRRISYPFSPGELGELYASTEDHNVYAVYDPSRTLVLVSGTNKEEVHMNVNTYEAHYVVWDAEHAARIVTWFVNKDEALDLEVCRWSDSY